MAVWWSASALSAYPLSTSRTRSYQWRDSRESWSSFSCFFRQKTWTAVAFSQNVRSADMTCAFALGNTTSSTQRTASQVSRLLVGYYIYSGVHIKFGVPHKWTEHLTQLREAERRRDEAVARMDQLLAEMGYAR